MPNKRYESGRRHEYALKRKWEKDGWTVLRTAGSHGPFDLVAIEPTFQRHAEFGEYREIALIQAKSGKSAERERKKLSPLKAKFEGIYAVRVELL